MEELSKIGVLEIAIGGGEPLLHKHCLEIFQSITRNEMNLIITTNGSLVNEQLVEALSAIAPLEVRVSFDGGPQLHDSIRGRGAYNKAIAGLSKLIAGRIPASVRLTLSRGGDHELSTLFDDAANIGTKKVKVALTKSIGRATEQGKHLVRAIESGSTSEWLMKLGLKSGILVELSSEDFATSSLPIVDSKLRVLAPHCGAGFETAYISATGNVTACVAMPSQTFGELHTNSFTQVWLGGLATEYRDWARGCNEQRICDACVNKCK
jgi:MoaA/NifB/PqqE/SkfB family radical SAM enzyme